MSQALTRIDKQNNDTDIYAKFSLEIVCLNCYFIGRLYSEDKCLYFFFSRKFLKLMCYNIDQ